MWNLISKEEVNQPESVYLGVITHQVKNSKPADKVVDWVSLEQTATNSLIADSAQKKTREAIVVDGPETLHFRTKEDSSHSAVEKTERSCVLFDGIDHCVGILPLAQTLECDGYSPHRMACWQYNGQLV